MPDLTLAAWALLALAAVLVGFAKTAIGGVASVAVVVFATVLPARESTGALLVLLLTGDLLAVSLYRRHASWGMLLRLLPGVVPGLVLGTVFLALVDDAVVRVSIGVILLGMTVLQLVRRRSGPRAAAEGGHPPWWLTLLIGVLAGFSTMTANAAGPVMTLYLILAGLPMLQMLGTGAWFFLTVNLLKVPFSTGLGLISVESMLMDLALVPAMLVGGAIGAAVIRRIDQRQFEAAALMLGAVTATLLLV